MNVNPEFQRQLNLECSQAYLTGIPLALGIVFTFGYLIDGHRLGDFTAKAALTLFLFITLLWGARQALYSIIEEYRDRTWDIQRLSALGPWEMTWGKLLGSTSMVWYGGIICLLVYSLATEETSALHLLIFYGVGAGLVLQSGSLLLGLLAVLRGQNKSDFLFVIAVIAFFLLVPWLMDSSQSSYYDRQQVAIDWYGMLIDKITFYRVSLLAALFWCTVGSYRLMAQALGLRTLPWVWLGFMVFLTVSLGGFIPASSYSFSLAVLVVCSGLTYIGVLAERHDAMRIKHFLTYFSSRNWRRAGEEMPIWSLSFALTLPAASWLSLTDHPLRLFSDTFHFYPLAIVLILLRDCAVYLYFVYGQKPQRAFSMTLLAGVFLYGILPGLLNLVGLSGLSALAFPLWADTAGGATICAALQTGLILKLLYHRWKSKT